MPNPLALSVMAGMAGGGTLGYMSARNDRSQDGSDKAGTTVMSAATGGVLGAIGAYLPWRQLGRGMVAGGRVSMGAGRMMTANPMRSAMKAMGRTSFSMPKGMKGPVGLLALTAAAIGIGAAGARHRVPHEREDTGESETFNSLNTQGVKERMGMMGAAGDMVFGLNNSRHG